MDDKDKAEIVEQVSAVKDEAQKKASDILKSADKIVNSPEANIIGAIGGEKVEGKIKEGQKIVGDLSHNPLIVGKNAFAEFQGQREHQLVQSGAEHIAPTPPVVSAIQAVDQYGNVLASAQNPKVYQLMQEQ